MKRSLAFTSIAALGLMALACSDSSAPTAVTGTPAALSTAFSSLPLRFSIVSSSFADSGPSDTTLWRPGDREDGPDGRGGLRGGRGPGGRGGRGGRGGFDMGRGNGGMPGAGGMMGGGLGGPFGGAGFDLGFGHGLRGARLPSNCAFDVTSGRVNCPPDTTHAGVTVTRSAAYADAAGAVQSAFDSATTNSINLRVEVSGTIVRRDGDTSVVEHSSDRTVTGLAPGSTSRTVNGTSSGNETTSGTDTTGHFLAVRMVGDTINGVVIPVPAGDSAATDDHDGDIDGPGHGGPPPFPTAGTIVRSMTVTVTRGSTAPTTSSRREVVTYNGDGTATVVITHDGTTKICTQSRGARPVCN